MLRYVDHAIIGVADLDAAAHDYAGKLGFAVGAGGVHPGMGTHNRLIVLDPEYIELLARVPDAEVSPLSPVGAMLRRAPGCIGFALGSDDIEADVAAMRERGLTVDGPSEGRLETAPGVARGWRTARPRDDARLGADAWRLPFLIEHDSAGRERLERIARPGGLHAHAVGARSLSHLTIAVRDLAAGLRAYKLAFGLEPDDEGEDPMLRARAARLPLPRGALVLAAPLPGDGPLARDLQTRGEGLYSIGITVDNLQDAVDTMRGQGVGVRVEEPEGILLAARSDPTGAHGARLEFVQA